jgi:hypothetical protein
MVQESPKQEQLIEACRKRWQSALGLGLDPRADAAEAEETTYTSLVGIRGEWSGALLLECPGSVALHAAATLFEVDTDSPTPEDLQAATNELTRLVARGVRDLLCETAKVAAPKALENGHRPEAGLAQSHRLELISEGRPVGIELFKREPSADKDAG